MSMTREEFLDSLMKDNHLSDIESAGKSIQGCYENCCGGNQIDEWMFQQLIEQTHKMYRNVVRRELIKVGCYNEDNEATALQDAASNIWDYILKCRAQQIIQPSFSKYCKGIYYRRTMDIVRKALRMKRHFGDIESLDQPVNYFLGSVEHKSITKGESISTAGGGPVNLMMEEEKRSLYEIIIKMHLIKLTDCHSEPPKSLAYYYARLLPHILHVYYSEKTIPDSQGNSPKWAIKRMGNKTIGTLADESEYEMQNMISPGIIWCDYFYERINEEVDTSEGKKRMKSIVYTEEYQEKNIGRWADMMNRHIRKECLTAIRTDKKLKNLVLEYMEEMNNFSAFLERK